MRLLLISDTHGKLGIINELAKHTQADAIYYLDICYSNISILKSRFQKKISLISKEECDG
jgi:hypothetical protein